MQPYTIELELHYYLNEEHKHAMDAVIHNKCETQFLNAINHISKTIGCDIKIEVCALEEGGVKDNLKILVTNNISNITVSVLTAALTSFVTCSFNPQKNFLENTQKRMEIISSIKANGLTEEQAAILVEGDSHLENIVSNLFKNVSKEDTVTSVETSLAMPGQDTISYKINRKDFEKKIINTNKKEIYRDKILNTDITVVSPVLLHTYKPVWKCKYNGEDIDVIISDNSFLDQVYNKEVKFESGIKIKCDMDVYTEVYSKNKKPVKKYTVVLVKEWSDGDTYKTETKRYKSLKAERDINTDY